MEVSKELKKSGYSVVRPDHHVSVFPRLSLKLHPNIVYRSKAVSDGAISFYIDHFVNTRVSKITYGSRGSIDYNPNNPEHVKRQHNAYVAVSGEKRINDVFYVILATVSSFSFSQMTATIIQILNLLIETHAFETS